jgi:hypothetical protein
MAYSGVETCSAFGSPSAVVTPRIPSIHRHEGELGVRRILGVLSLAKKHGAPTVDVAAKTALDLGAPSYRFMRRWLERPPPAPLTLRQIDPLIRHLSLYRDLKAVQELLGHATIEMTMRYAHLSPDARRDAVSVLDLPVPDRTPSSDRPANRLTTAPVGSASS